MPSSNAETIPKVVSLIKQIRPESILDVWTGFGKWGMLFREYTDIIASEKDPDRYQKTNWKVRIEGIEGFSGYLTPAHSFFYDRVHIGLAQEVLPRLGEFDVVFMGDIIEHLTLEQGKSLLREALSHSRRYLIVSTPRYDTGQQKLCGNELEKHLSLWTPGDFRDIGEADVLFLPGEVQLAIIRRPGQPRVLPRVKRTRSTLKNRLGDAARAVLGEDWYFRLRSKI